ncbi:MAG TPA: hypothetical protein VJ083_00425 [Sedimentibacter sp.]|jgi:Zn ribbon nucleic-acid-binding protein|nr:hypothetical protein [Sedimentibacter sp.]
MPRKLTQEEYCNKFYKKNPKDFEVIGEYVNTDTEIMIRHTVCGNEYLRKPEKLLSRGASCPKCNPYAKIRRTQDEFEKDAYDRFGDKYSVVGKYINIDSNVPIRHNECGTVWSPNANAFLRGAINACPHCSKGGVSMTQEEFEKRIESIEEYDEYKFLEEYQGYDTKIPILHKDCGYEYYVSPNKFISGRRCPKCKATVGEKKVIRIMNKLKIPYVKEKSYIGLLYDKAALRFDFFVNNSFLIEYDGIQHFKPIRWNKKMSDEEVNELFVKTQYRDIIKNEFCRDNKMNLYRIAYTELEFIDEIVLDIIEKERSTTIPKGSTLQAYGSGNGESVKYTMI